LEFLVNEAEAGERLDRVLAARVPQLSRMRLRQALDQGAVRVNGEARPAGWRVDAGCRVTLDLPLDLTTAMTPEPLPVTILYEDTDLVVVEKPAGMVVHPAGRHQSGTLANALAYHFNVAGGADPPVRPGIVHRLDRATSGLLVVAKHQAALSRLTVQFQGKDPRGKVEKRYLALVHGRVEAEAGEWEAPIGSDPQSSPRWGIREGGRPAHTRFQVRERWEHYTLLELEPVTGRTNQLRLHCAHFGHPILGDELFGRGQEPGLGRLFLHACRLGFIHPASGERLLFESPLPPELDQYLQALHAPAQDAAQPGKEADAPGTAQSLTG
jgi:23S rRNA pseudouridine1911/1915/1917 synthase